MPTPIPFSVAAAARGSPQGQTFSSPQVTKQAGYTKIYWEFAIPDAADYENAANSIVSRLLVNGVDAASTWVGGRSVNKLGVVDAPVAVEFDIAAVPVGATLQVQLTVTAPAAFMVGIQNGSIT